MPLPAVAAVDLGATSGRVIVGNFSLRDGLELTEVHRFPNAFHRLGPNEYWAMGRIFSEMVTGLAEAKRLFPDLASCGVNSWGVDHVLLGEDGRLLFPVHAYRDSRTEPIVQELRSDGRLDKLYELTGISTLPFNTSFQLAESLRTFPQLAERAARVLFVPDYMNFLLTGQMDNEISISSTSQLLSLDKPVFSQEALDLLGLPSKWFAGPQPAGETLGWIQDLDGLADVEVSRVPGHDTSCAFEAIPRQEDGDDLILSTGTWLLASFESREPVHHPDARDFGLSHERCGNGNFRPVKNLIGMWLLEQLLPQFTSRPKSDAEWNALINAASEAPEPDALFNANDPSLFNPKDMRAAIDRLVREAGGKPPETLPAYVRLICGSLAGSVARTVERLGVLRGRPFRRIVVVGGGSKNRLFCQLIADHAHLKVSSYALEGSSAGNIAYQLLALRLVEDLATFREGLAKGINQHSYQPS